ncbi:helix-turn-helix domain-containing protein [Pseudenhygromyxa sp. WMMC2535]|uniref:substrate-binding domain-containing protein n=1 Tax=Pseudenhygromyxa sp. WMMC2535 TaxID=2712867 RepID=UPI001595D730|nr:substrate-binding domain-containing protein [Pseudenhygromyxa sp. WMMC2535]NVB42616.1 helix-turn-helix domain-containing protein [Pseudenhygromyxa sp. WMMC2535]
MERAETTSAVRQKRSGAGLSQADLAARVGVSRQALSAIEAGRQTPSTTLALKLARALRCTVDELFRLAGGPVVHALLVRPSAGASAGRVVLGRVDGRLVAHALAHGSGAADGLLLDTGDAGVGDGQERSAAVEILGDPTLVAANVLVAGCAPLLGVLAARLGQRYRDGRASWIPADSGRALELLRRGAVHVAGLHLGEASDPEAQARAARAAVGEQRAVLVNLARWRQGLVIPRGNPLGITGPEDLLRPGLRCTRRGPGSGAQRLLERARAAAGEAPGEGAEVGAPLAADHAEVARLVRWGVADLGVAIEAVALAEGLDFIPLAEERFDLAIPEHRLSTPEVARLIDLIDRPSFRAEVAGLPGYDLSLAGHASTIAPSRGQP